MRTFNPEYNYDPDKKGPVDPRLLRVPADYCEGDFANALPPSAEYRTPTVFDRLSRLYHVEANLSDDVALFRDSVTGLVRDLGFEPSELPEVDEGRRGVLGEEGLESDFFDNLEVAHAKKDRDRLKVLLSEAMVAGLKSYGPKTGIRDNFEHLDGASHSSNGPMYNPVRSGYDRQVFIGL